MSRESVRVEYLAPAESRRFLLLAALLMAIGVGFTWQQARQMPGIDFYQFWAGGQLSRRGENPYDHETRRKASDEFLRQAMIRHDGRMFLAARLRRDLELYSTPFLYVCSAVLSPNYDRAYTAFQAVSLAAFLTAMLLFSRMAALRTPPALLLIAFVLLLFQPMRAEVRVGNINELQLLVIAVYLVLTRGERTWMLLAGGIVFGAALLLKPNILLVLLLAAICRFLSGDRRRLGYEVAGVCAGVLFAFAVTALWFGTPRIWIDFAVDSRWLLNTFLSRAMGNVAIMLPIAERVGPAANYTAAALLLVPVVIAFARRRVTQITAHRRLMVAGLAFVVHLLSAPLVWYHYLLLSLPLAIALLAIRPCRVAAVAALTLIAADPWNWLLHFRGAGGEAVIVNTGLLVLYGTGVWACFSSVSIRESLRDAAH